MQSALRANFMQQVFGPGRADSQVQFEQTRPRVLALLASVEFVHPHTLKQERSPTYSHEVQIYPVFQRRKHTNLPILYSIIFLDVFFLLIYFCLSLYSVLLSHLHPVKIPTVIVCLIWNCALNLRAEIQRLLSAK